MKQLIAAAVVAVLAWIVAVAALASPTGAGATTLRGVVVAERPARHTIAVAAQSGAVTTVHRTPAIRIGTRVVVSGARVRLLGRSSRARIHGVVIERLRSRFVLSAGHSTLTIRSGRRAADTTPTGPAPGTVITTEVEIDDQGELAEQETDEQGEVSTVEVEGVLATDVAAGATSIVVLVEQGVSVTVQIPSALKLPALKKGTEVELKATVSGTMLTATKVELEDDQGEDEDNNDDD